MAVASILLDGGAGPLRKAIGAANPALTNSDNTGVTAWLWELVSKPEGSSATILTPTASTATLNGPDVPGSYKIRLTVNGNEDQDTTLVYEEEQHTRLSSEDAAIRVPAQSERLESGSDGWATEVQRALQLVDRSYGGEKRITVKVDSGYSGGGNELVWCVTGKAALPDGQEVPEVSLASAAALATCEPLLFNDTGETITASGFFSFMIYGFSKNQIALGYTPANPEEPVFLGLLGGITNEPTIDMHEVQIGHVVGASGANGRVFFQGRRFQNLQVDRDPGVQDLSAVSDQIDWNGGLNVYVKNTGVSLLTLTSTPVINHTNREPRHGDRFRMWNMNGGGGTSNLDFTSGSPNTIAELDLGTLAGGDLDTVVQANLLGGPEGNAITVELTAASVSGVVISVVGNAVTIDIEDGVSTVSDVENAIAALTGTDAVIRTKTPGTGATVLAAGDVFSATNLAGGTRTATGILSAVNDTEISFPQFLDFMFFGPQAPQFIQNLWVPVQKQIDEEPFPDGGGFRVFGDNSDLTAAYPASSYNGRWAIHAAGATLPVYAYSDGGSWVDVAPVLGFFGLMESYASGPQTVQSTGTNLVIGDTSSGNFDITLPDYSGSSSHVGKLILIRNASATNTLTIKASGGATIGTITGTAGLTRLFRHSGSNAFIELVMA